MRTAHRGRRPFAPVVALTLALLVGTFVTGAVTGTGHEARGAAPVAEPQRARGLNVVVVMADDMRVDDLRFAPRLRRLVAARGLSFENSFSPYPLCCPARASFLTGTYAHNHHVWWHGRPLGYSVFDDSRTLATSLRKAGYRTGFVGKYLNGYGPMRSLVSGRPSYRYVPRGWSDWRAAIDPGVRGVHGSTYNYWDIPLNVNGRVDNSHRREYSSAVIGDQAVAMAGRFSKRPGRFFMYVNFVAPHFGAREPGDPPTRARDRSGEVWDFRTPGRPRSVRGRFDPVIKRGAGMPRGGGPSEKDISDKPATFRRAPEPAPRERRLLREVTRQRAESVYVMDREIARLVARLKRTGEWRRTVFMFTSDNGYFLGEHRRRTGKVRAHEPSLRVPFLVTGPGMRSGGHRFDPITTIDVSATILDIAGAAPPRRPDGVSRLRAMRRGDRGWTTPVLTESAWPGRLPQADGFDDRRTTIGIRTARYSMIRNRTELDELYDLRVDPLQNRNVYGDPSYREIRRDLLETWTRTRNCAGAGCRVALPPSLATAPDRTRSLTRHYWKVVDRTYGW